VKQSARPRDSGGKPCVPRRKDRIEIDGPLKELFREGVILRAGFTEMPQTSLICGPGVEAPRRLADRALLLGVGDDRGYGDGNRLGNLILYRKEVGKFSIVPICPNISYSLRHSSICRQLLSGVPTRIVAVNHDTSTVMLERVYSAHIGDHADALTRAALLDVSAAAAELKTHNG
jgi:hypothetical protein